jgi:selenocysteine-specific elongation factor
VTLVVGTAGHIDHGKTTLLRALTGIDADRLPEERERGMTIDVGYAWLEASGDEPAIDFVDVPGHDRLVGNMLVGAGEVDAVLLVVAADDGPRAQTIEHLELVDALGLRHGVVAITKADAAERERVEAVAGQVRRLLAATGLADVPILPVSALSGEGIDPLRAALRSLAAPARPPGPGPRLAIDRAFTVRGRGAVVTGTLRGGAIATGDALELVPDGRRVRVREVQAHGRRVDRSDGGRTALNLAGIEVGDLRRGQVLAAPGVVEAADRLLVVLRPPSPIRVDAGGLPPDRARLRLHLGTEQVDARVGRSGREAVALDDVGVTAVLRLDAPIAAAAGDGFVLRQPSPARTAAGGIVLDPAPPRGAARRRVGAERLRRLEVAVRAGEAAALRDARLELHGARGADLAPDVAARIDDVALRAVAEHHRAHPDDPGMPLTALRRDLVAALRRQVSLAASSSAAAVDARLVELVSGGRLVREADRLRDPARPRGGPSHAAQAAMERLVAALDTPAPPPLADAARAAGVAVAAIRELEREGRIVRVEDDIAWSAEAWQRLARLALERATAAPLSPAELRDATGTSRKYVMALLEDLGRRGILARTPAGHVPGPRAGLVRDREPVA